MTDVPHFGFILAAYGVTAAVLLSVIAAVVLDGRAQRRLLAKLEGRRPTANAARESAEQP